MSIISLRDLWYAVVLSSTLVAVILGFMAIYQFFIEPKRRQRKINRRLSEGYEERLAKIQILKERSEAQSGWWAKLTKTVLGQDRMARLRTLILQADMSQDPTTFLKRSLMLVLAGSFAGFLVLQSFLAALLLGTGLGTVPFFHLKWKRRIKTKNFERLMPDAMELLARSLRAGHTLPSALELLGEEMESPIGTEMAIAYEEQQFGISTSESLLHMLERVESMDLRYFVAAVLIQQETGGNLAELMENIARVIRSRLNFKSKVRSLTAMGRISTTIMIIAPIVTFLGLMLIASHYERILFESRAGRVMLLAGIIFVFIGGFSLRKMIQAVEM
jgi:tight adherence protein B